MSSPLNPSANSTGADAEAAAQAAQLKAQEEKLRKMYGNRLPLGPKAKGPHILKERKYFDSGDYALSQAGKTTGPVGSEHPQPENIPHSNPTTNHGSPPVKESSLIHESELPEGASSVVAENRSV